MSFYSNRTEAERFLLVSGVSGMDSMTLKGEEQGNGYGFASYDWSSFGKCKVCVDFP